MHLSHAGAFEDPASTLAGVTTVGPSESPPQAVRAHHVHNGLVGIAIVVLVVIGAAATFFGLAATTSSVAQDKIQQSLAPFYLPPSDWQVRPPGSLLRSEILPNPPKGSLGWRILYATQRANGAPAVSSGLVFAPRGAKGSTPAGRPVVAWAHPTVGMGDACAPSRSTHPGSGIPGLVDVLNAGWVVTATDYAGLGTPGVEQYLIGNAEAHDVLNSVRAARHLPRAFAGSTVGLWGHSQGGQAALWAADLRSYAPELSVVGAAAAAPAAELPALISHQWSTIYGSLIGAEVLVSYPDTYGDLRLTTVSSRSADSVAALANRCLTQAAIDIVISKVFGRSSLLSRNPEVDGSWRAAISANTPPVPQIPTLIIQGLTDPIVLPGTNAAFLERSCRAGAPIQGAFIGALGHMKAGKAGAPLAFTWLQQRFGGVTMTSTCGTRLPVRPLGISTN